jgi:FkbM family methyltransferase
MSLPVWLYWEGELPDWINECRKTVFAHATNVQLIDPARFDELRDYDRDIELGNLCTAHRADFIRAFLLAKFGGLWVDADCVVMRSLLPLMKFLNEYDFIGYKERGGYVSNNFMGAKQGSEIAIAYYNCVCSILRSGKTLEWLTLGSNALTATINEISIPWYELEVGLIQPICWSEPEAFFETRNDDGHERASNSSSYCYMLSANMTNGFVQQHPSKHLLDENTFFRYLLKKSSQQKEISKLMNIAYRKNTDDDNWVIPEVISNDMYRIKNTIAKLEPAYPSYVIDCGAHIGAFSIMCSMYLKHTEILAFEPNPDSFYYLEKNAENFQNIKPYQKAVDFKDSTLSLYPPDQSDWSGRWTCLPNANDPITVESVNLFSFIKQLDKPVFIVKMDLEGYEELIIKNTSPEDLNMIKTLVVETHTEDFDHKKLKDCGFKLLFNPDISSARQFVYVND